MSRFYNSFDDSQAEFDDEQEGFGNDFSWGNQDIDGPPRPMFNRNRRPHYSNAYGDYRGGYGPGGGFGPRPLMPPPPPLFCPPMPPPRMPMWGRGFGPAGPPVPRKNLDDERAIKYLMRCGATKESLKNLPHDLLRLIQPEYCGLCDFTFESFTTSRMHYISKNHLKNQKKWLSKARGAFQNEMPLKARNLYCELCDIQITSKTHGEAHYDGKPHRGIVDGRKKPKNPLLLQSGMQHRLEQLIRREKRFLKPTNQKTEAKAEAGKDLKNVSPELYCEICKTTVTCSEQMTMHMNGKRHLSKEKNHILNMMRGKDEDEYMEDDYEDEDEGENDGEGKGEGENEAEAQMDEGEGRDATKPEDEIKDDATGDDCWSEAWDETEKTASIAQE